MDFNHQNCSNFQILFVLIDVTPPVITLVGAVALDVPHNSVYIDGSATALDDTDGVVEVSVDNQVDTMLLVNISQILVIWMLFVNFSKIGTRHKSSRADIIFTSCCC